MSIVFYEAPMSSATPVARVLSELGVPHERVRFDLAKGEQRSPEFLALNPNGKVPTLVVDGTPLFEGLAIAIWLGERFGVEKGLWPRTDSIAHGQAITWCTWAYVTYGSLLGRRFMATSPRLPESFRNEAIAQFAERELNALLDILDARLAKQAHMLGDAFTPVDAVVASTLGWGATTGVSVAKHPHVAAWLARCEARPSFLAEPMQ